MPFEVNDVQPPVRGREVIGWLVVGEAFREPGLLGAHELVEVVSPP
jgi:hypothetical protein